MEVKRYLEDKLKNCSKYELTDLDKSYLNKHSVADFVFKKLTSKKYRKWAIDDLSTERIKEAISINTKKGDPIKFTYPFGGYKLWRIKTFPEVDWAEFFAIAYYVNYISSILRVYKPGVEFIFSSDDLIIERMDNISKSDTNAYFDSFARLLKEFSRYFPDNMRMEIKRVSDLYDKAELEAELAENFDKLKKAYPDMSDDRKKRMLKTSELNIKMNGFEPWDKLSPKEQKEKIDFGVIYHDAQCNLIKRREFVRGKDKIVLFTTVVPNAIAIGTTKSSVTKFWTGFGVLGENGDSYKDIILSPKQLEESVKMQEERVDLIPLKNFENVSIVPDVVGACPPAGDHL